jgi:hypothetical protein
LIENGYRLVDTRGPEQMDSGFNVYAGSQLVIRIIADRSQWFVEVHPRPEMVDTSDRNGWFNLEAWSTCLGAPASFRDTRPTLTDEDWAAVLTNSWWLEPQLEYLRDHLAQIEEACASKRVEATVACLSKARRALSAFPPRRRNLKA